MKYVYVSIVGDRIRILNQDDEMILDFLRDEKIAQRIAFGINARGTHGLL